MTPAQPTDSKARTSKIKIKLRTPSAGIELEAPISLDQWLRVLDIINEKVAV